jgi:hypothetical protein
MEFKVKRNCQQIIRFSFSSHHEKISLGLRVLDLNSKVQILILRINKQNNKI